MTARQSAPDFVLNEMSGVLPPAVPLAFTIMSAKWKSVGGSEKRYQNGGEVDPTQEGHSW